MKADMGGRTKHNTDLIRRNYEAFNRRDMGPLLESMHPDFELDFSGSLGPERGIYHGEEGMRMLFEPYWDAFETISIEPEEFFGSGDVIVAVVRARGRGRGSGVEVDARGPHAWSFRDRKVVGFTLYQELDAALDAVGLTGGPPHLTKPGVAAPAQALPPADQFGDRS